MLKITNFIYLNVFIIFFISRVFATLPENSVYNLESNLIDKNGNCVNLVDFRGKIQIFSMIYTNCKTICPIIVSNMKSIEKLLPDNIKNDVIFSLVTLDPDRDNIANMKKFFNEKKLNDNMWRLFKTTKEETLKLSLAVCIKYKKDKNDEYIHSNLIIILDNKGVIRLHHQGLDKNYSKIIDLLVNLNKED